TGEKGFARMAAEIVFAVRHELGHGSGGSIVEREIDVVGQQLRHETFEEKNYGLALPLGLRPNSCRSRSISAVTRASRPSAVSARRRSSSARRRSSSARRR